MAPNRGLCGGTTSWAKMPKEKLVNAVAGGILVAMVRMGQLQIGCLSARTVGETKRRTKYHLRIVTASFQQRRGMAAGRDLSSASGMRTQEEKDVEKGWTATLGSSPKLFFAGRPALSAAPAEAAGVT